MIQPPLKNKPADGLLSQWLPIAIQYVGSSSSMAFKMSLELITFTLLARYLGDEQFGKLMTITAATQIAVGLCGLGSDEPMTRRLVRDASLYPMLLGHSLVLIAASGLVLALISILGLYFFVPMAIPAPRHLMIMAIFAFSNIALFRWISLTESIFIGRREYMRANGVVVAFSAARMLTALTATLIFRVDSLQTWALWHGAIYIVGALGCAISLRPFGGPRWCLLLDELKRGIHIIIPNFLNGLRQNLDIIVLSLVTSPSIVGNYGVASRVVQASLVAGRSLNRIMYPRLVVAGEHGCASVFRLASHFVVAAAGLGALTSVGLFLIAPYGAVFFGKGFVLVSTYLKVLCWLAFLSAIHDVAFDSLGAIEKHGLRAAISNTISVVGAGLVVPLTYFYGVNGAFVSLFLSQMLATSGLWIVLLYLTRRELRFGLTN